MTPRKTVRFYYSIGSRYSYLASTQIGKLERETECRVVWHPLHSVDLYRLRGVSPFEGEPISGQYDWDYRRQDAERWAEYYGVPYEEPRGVVDFDPRLLARAWRRALWASCAPTAPACSRPSSWRPCPR